MANLLQQKEGNSALCVHYVTLRQPPQTHCQLAACSEYLCSRYHGSQVCVISSLVDLMIPEAVFSKSQTTKPCITMFLSLRQALARLYCLPTASVECNGYFAVFDARCVLTAHNVPYLNLRFLMFMFRETNDMTAELLCFVLFNTKLQSHI